MVIAAVCVGSSTPRILRMVPTLMAMHSFHSFKPALNSKRFQLGPSLDTRPKALTRAFFRGKRGQADLHPEPQAGFGF